MNEQALKQFFKILNRFMVWMWRLGLGKWINIWPAGIGRIMVLIHTGRKSGLKRRTPVNYAVVDGDLYCVAAFGQSADWLRNIQAMPEVQVWLPEGWWTAEAQLVEDTPARLPVIRQILINSGFAAYAFEGIKPRKMSDSELAQLSDPYQLVRIRCIRQVTGPGAMADLAWVWQAAAGSLLVYWLFWRVFRKNRLISRKLG